MYGLTPTQRILFPMMEYGLRASQMELDLRTASEPETECGMMSVVKLDFVLSATFLTK